MKKTCQPPKPGAQPRNGELIKIAVIDDNPDDRELVVRELSREGKNYQLRHVATGEALYELLEKLDCDVVITDYELRWDNGLNVLRVIKQKRPDLPVIMFTGSGSEEIAVESMKAGLDDYVLKSPRQYRRLSIAVQSALKLREKRRELESAENRYKQLFDTVPVGLFRCSPGGELLDVNRALLEILGFSSKEEMLKKRLGELHLFPQEFSRWREMLERDGAVAHIESQFRHVTSGFRWVKIHAKALRDRETGQVYYEGSVEDITQWKREEGKREARIQELEEAVAKGGTLSGLLPICSGCKKIRDEHGEWNQLEMYIRSHTQAEFTHSFCPECMKQLYPEIFVDMPK